METTTKFGRLLDNNKVEFDSTMNGFCYKDYEAFDSGNGIAYIPEYGINDNDEIETSYTRADIIKIVAQHLKATGQYRNKKHAIEAAEYTFDNVDWQFVETFLNEADFSEE